MVWCLRWSVVGWVGVVCPPDLGSFGAVLAPQDWALELYLDGPSGGAPDGSGALSYVAVMGCTLLHGGRSGALALSVT